MLLEEEFDFRFDLGIATRTDKVSIQDKDDIISAIAKHFCVFVIKSELDQILCGLSSTLGMLEVFRNNTTAMRPLLVCSNTKFSADSMYDAFHICFSPDGSNKRHTEEATVMLWVHFLQAIERKDSVLYSMQEIYYLSSIMLQGGKVLLRLNKKDLRYF